MMAAKSCVPTESETRYSCSLMDVRKVGEVKSAIRATSIWIFWLLPRIFVAGTAALLVAAPATAESRVQKNVVYGMYSGLALLMDVDYPQTPNGYGLILIPGSGWHTSQEYDATSIKDGGSGLFVSVPSLLNAGYTLFIISHRAAPRFRYPAAVEDTQRAVRFIRFHANDYGINAERIGAVGYSSGAHLATLLGVLDGSGSATDPDPVNRVSARVQSVVASATPTDLQHFNSGSGVPNVTSFLGQLPPTSNASPESSEAKAYRAASPVTHISRMSAPLLLIHGEADETVPFQQAQLMVAAAQRTGAEVRLIRLPGGTHRFALDLAKHPEWPDVLNETTRWLDQHLKIVSAK
jgi:acetyl esterase/lipase